MENKKELDEEIKKFERNTSIGCFQSILVLITIIILWIVTIGLGTLVIKLCWEVIKFIWELW